MLLNVRFQEHSGRRLQRELLCWWATWRTAQRQSVRLCRGTLRQTTLKYARPVRRAIGRRSTRKPKARSTRRQKALRDPHHGVGQHPVVTLPPPIEGGPYINLFYDGGVSHFWQLCSGRCFKLAHKVQRLANGLCLFLKPLDQGPPIGRSSKLYPQTVQWLLLRGGDNGQSGLLHGAFCWV